MIDETDDSAYAENRDWRAYFSGKLEGDGIELGPLHKPMETHALMKVKYVDRLPVAELRKHYPELAVWPLVEADILDDAQTLTSIFSNQFDFVIASHVVEHMSDPIRAISNWLRVLKVGGLLYLVVPDKRKIFDAPRARTTLAHLVNDYVNPMEAIHFEHFIDYAVHVDKKEDPDEALKHAIHLRDIGYSVHYHVFLPKDIAALLEWFKKNVSPIEICEGPIMSVEDSEFHVIIEKR